MKMKFKLNVKTITLSVIVFIVTIISLYYLILDMDGIAFAEQIDQITQSDQPSNAEEELKKKEEENLSRKYKVEEELKKIEEEEKERYRKNKLTENVIKGVILLCLVVTVLNKCRRFF